jgi:hypothetical protein
LLHTWGCCALSPPPIVGHAAPSMFSFGRSTSDTSHTRVELGSTRVHFFLGDLEHHHTLDCGNWDVAFLAIACLLDLRRRFYDIYTRPDKLKCSNEITLLVFRMCLMIYRWVGVTKVLCLV